MENFYEVLGINVNASKEEIKAAYNKMIKVHHPDRNNDHVSSKFTTELINEAYETLMDDEKRKLYDLKHGIIVREPEVKVIYRDRLLQSTETNWKNVVSGIAAILMIALLISAIFGDRK